MGDWRFGLRLLFMLGAGILSLSCQRRAVVAPQPPAIQEAAPLAPQRGLPWFENVTAASGIQFTHYDSATATEYILERLGSGLGWIDYDGDGWLDLFCVQDGPVPSSNKGRGEGAAPTNKLFRNNGNGSFTDVTELAGLSRAGYGMGCAIGDYDNDGFDDLLVTYFGSVVLYHNEPDGKGSRKFADVTSKSGLSDPHWATGCAWGDVDGDGYLDLYVCNYVEVSFDKYPSCEDRDTTAPHGCPPSIFPHVAHRLFRNNRDGTFTDISKESGVAAAPAAPGLGVVMVDLDGDGLLDIYVANDLKPAYLFHNQGNGRFTEKGLLSGCGFGPRGRLMAGRGVAAADVDGSSRLSLLVTDFYLAGSVLFRNAGRLTFNDWSDPSGLGPASVHRLGFGTVFLDADLDGQVDVAVANGHIYRHEYPGVDRVGQPFKQEAQLFLGNGRGGFRDVSKEAGQYFRERYLGRGLACADYDNDGRPDLAFSNNVGPAVLLANRTDGDHRWVRLELVGDGQKSNRNAIGARVEIEAGGAKQVRFLNGGGSYLSASDRRLLIGLGKADRVERVTVRWPSGRQQEFRDLQGRQWWRLREGQDRPEQVSPQANSPLLLRERGQG